MGQKTTGKKTRQEFLREEERTRPSIGVDAALSAGDENRRTRILLVDDHLAMRELISSALEEEADIVIVGEAADGEEAIHKTRQLRPDLILMDFSMPGIDGVEATRIIHSEFPDIRIIGLSLYQEKNRAAKMLEAGAATYVCKNEIFDKLIVTIRQESSLNPDQTT